MRILSFDCAYKTLGISYVDIDELLNQKCATTIDNIKLATNMYKIATDAMYDKHASNNNMEALLNSLQYFKNIIDFFIQSLNNFVKLLYGDVIDVTADIPGIPKLLKHTTAEQRMYALKKKIAIFDTKINQYAGHIDLVLLEYQMSANSLSREVYQILMYYYIDKTRVDHIGSALKQQMYVGGIKYDAFIESGSTSAYTANKKFAISLAHAISLISGESLKYTIPLSMRSHIADAYTQCFAYLQKYKFINLT